VFPYTAQELAIYMMHLMDTMKPIVDEELPVSEEPSYDMDAPENRRATAERLLQKIDEQK